MKSPPRVAYLIGQICDERGGPSGSEKQLLMLLQKIDRNLISPFLIIWNHQEIEKFMRPYRELNIPIYAVTRTWHRWGRLISLWRLMKILKIDYIQNYSPYLNFPIWLVTKFSQVKNCLGVFQSDFKNDLRDMNPFLARLCSRYPRRAIANSQRAIENIKQTGGPFIPSKIWHLPNAVDTSFFKPASHCVRKECDPLQIIGIGRLMPGKRWDWLLDILNELQEQIPYSWEVNLLGEGNERLRLQEKIKEMGFENRVFLRGYQTNSNEWLQKSDLYVFCSEYEGMPNAVMEAMACALPVVTTNVGDLKDVVQDGVNGFIVDLNDREKWKRDFLQLLQFPELRAKLGQQARTTIVNRFSTDSLFEGVLKIYREAGWHDFLPLRLFVSTWAFRPVWAGPAERFLRYAPGLKARGVELTYLTARRTNLPECQEESEYKVIRLGPENGSKAQFYRAAFKFTAKCSPRTSALIILNIDALQIFSIIWLRLLGIKCIYVSTMALSDIRESGQQRSRLRQSVLNLVQWVTALCLNRTVSSTSVLNEDFLKIGVPPSKLTIIPNGVSRQRFCPPISLEEKRHYRTELGFALNESLVLFVGLINERKGVLALVKAWQNFKKTGGPGRLVLVGDQQRTREINRPFFVLWDQLMAAVEPRDQIEWREPILEIEKYFKAADLFVFPSQQEGLPNVFLEAMSCGLPILTRHFEGFSFELGRDGVHFETLSIREEDWPNQIGLFLRDKAKRKRLSENGIKWIQEHHELSSTLDQYIDLIRKP